MSEFKVGDRVKINPDCAGGYKTPWDRRVRRGLFGTITDASDWGWRVQMDMPSRAKYPHEWIWGNVREKEMLKLDPQP